jgi:DNA-binding XRE family transcriptional regulator/Holliday junction resolvase-like predicted endonuclease
MVTPLRQAVGASVLAARVDRGWTQDELGNAAEVSRSLIAAIERGTRDASLESLERVARALDAELVVELRAPLVVGRADQRDAAHAACAAAVRRWLDRHGFECVTERPIVDGRVRGWIDLLAFDSIAKRLLVVEVKTELRDLGGLQRQVGWYVRAARAAVTDRGWRPSEVVALVVFLATAENDTRLTAQREAINQTFPLRGRALDDALAGGRFPGWGLTMVDPRRRGSRIWMGLRLDGRRLDAPYASYADFMRVVRVSCGVARGRR